jgi:murein DD-endopeptidase MepM/ murein hydrolase activator NlpD
LGWRLLILFAVVIGGFVLLVRKGDRLPAPVVTAPAPVAPIAEVPMAPPVGVGIPVAGVTPDRLNDTWGQARADGAREHHAIDIMAPRGTPVVAAAAGRIEKLFESKAGGHTIYIRRVDPAWIDYYAHLDTYAADLREGSAIKAGQQIGTVGSTGDADPGAPHLHYEIKQMMPGEKWWQGTNINPYPILHREILLQ